MAKKRQALSDNPNPPHPLGEHNELPNLQKLFWALKSDSLLTELLTRCLDLPPEIRLSVLEHWEMDLFIEEKRVARKAKRSKYRYDKNAFQAAVCEEKDSFGAKETKSAPLAPQPAETG